MKVLSIEKVPAPHDFDLAPPDPGRTPESAECVSVSTIKGYVAEALGVKNYDVDFSAPGMKMKAWIGMAIEDRLQLDLADKEPDRIAKPAEIRSPSGLVMGHPDGYYFASGGLTAGELGIDEIKHSYTSSKHYSSAESMLLAESGLVWDYLFQIRGYLAILRAMGIDAREARLWVTNPMGNWTDDRDPSLHCCRLLFSARELDNQMIQLERDAGAAYAWKLKGGK